MQIKFGTDGWRGIIAEDFTFDNVRACAQGVADYLKETGMAGRGLVVGYDTRFASQDFAQAVAEVVAANGVHVFLCRRPAPTPVVSYNIVARQAAGAVIITASHNPARWNGFKYKPDYAGSASPEVVAALERLIAKAQALGPVPRTPIEEALRRGEVEYVSPQEPYLAHIRKLVDMERIRASGLRVVSDAMFGAGAGYLPRLLRGGKLSIRELNARSNPLFPGIAQPEPIAQNLGRLSRAVAASGADVGIALDGDADRLGVVDERGEFLTPLQVFALLALYLLEVRGQRGPLVKSLTTSSMIRRLGELYDVPVLETPVGFKYIGPIMLKEQALIGGEESGGYGFRGHIPERDGVLSALYFLDMMATLKKRPSELLSYLYDKVGPHHYQRNDIHLKEGQREALLALLQRRQPQELDGSWVVETDATDGYRFLLDGGAWAVIRFSGTEPLLRLYAEAESPQRVERLLEAMQGWLGL